MRNPAQGQARGFLWFYFVNEHVMRFLNKRVPPGYDTVPLALFWALLVLWLVPWAVFSATSVARCAKAPLEIDSLGRGVDARRKRANCLFFLWPLVILLFFSFSTRRRYYTIPALPGVALLAGGWLARESSGSESGARTPRRPAILARADGHWRRLSSSWLGAAISNSPAASRC